jgi:pseudoazurin
MKLKPNRREFGIATAAVFLSAPAIHAAGHGAKVVKMLNADPGNSRLRNVFSPRLLTIEAGESVVFEATDRGHNSASLSDMLPGGSEGWQGRIGQDIEVTFALPGFYGYVCTPHATVGMVGLVVVQGDGKLDNLEAAKNARHRGRAKSVFEEIWEEVAAQGLDV